MMTGGLETAPETVTPETVPLETGEEADPEFTDDVSAGDDVSAEELAAAAASEAEGFWLLHAAVDTSIAAIKRKTTIFFINILHL